MMAGLNKAYEVKEERPWWKVLSIAFGLTISLGIMGLIALSAMFYGSGIWIMVNRDFGVHSGFPFLGDILPWLAAATLLFFSLALVYRFGPNLRDRRWQWSIPGAVIAVTIWIASTVLLRVYQNHFSSQRIYGGLQSVVALLLWLYITGAAVFIGGEANSEIEKAAARAGRVEGKPSGERRSGGKESPDNNE
jgi:membrane protein